MLMFRDSFRLPACLFWCFVLLTGTSNAEIGGREGRPTPFGGQVELANGECRFSIDVERVTFLVTRVANKYRFVRMLIDCRGNTTLALSATEDRLDMLVDGGDGAVATGILSLRQSDSSLWNTFDADMRRTLAYPPEVAPDRPVYVFAYFNVDDAASLPDGFEFRIASLDKTVRLMNLTTAARN